MQLTHNQIFALSEAISRLDGQHVTQLIEGKAVAIFRSHQIAASARWLLARAQGILQSAIADFNRAKDVLINQHSAGTGSLAATHPNFPKFIADLEEMKSRAVELPLEQISPAHLKLDENEKAGTEIPIAVLKDLSPLIKSEAA